jgi:uncharacterized membrane protein
MPSITATEKKEKITTTTQMPTANIDKTTDVTETTTTSTKKASTAGEIISDSSGEKFKLDTPRARIVGRILLFVGIIMIIVGTSLSTHWTLSFMDLVHRKTIPLSYVMLENNSSAEFNANLTQRNIPLVTVVLISQLVNNSHSELANVPTILARISDFTNQTLLEGNFTKRTVTSFEPEKDRTYILHLVNGGIQPTIINGLFGYFPFINSQAQINPERFQQILAGSIVFIIGFICILSGVPIRLYGIYLMHKKLVQKLY